MGSNVRVPRSGLHILTDPPLSTHYSGLLGDPQEGLGSPFDPDPLQGQPRFPGCRVEMEALRVGGQVGPGSWALTRVLKKPKRLVLKNQTGRKVA